MAVKCWNPQGYLDEWQDDSITVWWWKFAWWNRKARRLVSPDPSDFFVAVTRFQSFVVFGKARRLSSKPPSATKGSKQSDFSEDGIIRMVFGFDWTILCCIPDFTGSCFAGMETGAVDMWQLMNDMNQHNAVAGQCKISNWPTLRFWLGCTVYQRCMRWVL